MGDRVIDPAKLPGRTPTWRRIIEFPVIALALALAALMIPLTFYWPLLVALGERNLPGWIDRPLSAVLAIAIAVAVAKVVVPWLDPERRDDLPFDRRSLDGLRGALLAAGLMTLIVGIAYAMGAYAIDGWGGSSSWRLLWLSAGFQAAFVEEIVARGILFRFLESLGGSWFALALSSALFGLGHLANPNATLWSAIAIAIEAGIMLGGAYMLTRNLWLAIGLHFGWNVTQGYIWDVPVSGNPVDGLVSAHPAGPEILSGGMFGLEASIIALALATPLGAWFVYRAALRGKLVRPWWVRRRLAREAMVVT
jgi:membrane protease YdiL (CAAX protease family)